MWDIVWTTYIEATLLFFYFYYFYFCCFSPSHYYKYNKQTGKLYLYNLIRITENVWLSEKSFLIAGVIIYTYIQHGAYFFAVAFRCIV